MFLPRGDPAVIFTSRNGVCMWHMPGVLDKKAEGEVLAYKLPLGGCGQLSSGYIFAL